MRQSEVTCAPGGDESLPEAAAESELETRRFTRAPLRKCHRLMASSAGVTRSFSDDEGEAEAEAGDETDPNQGFQVAA